MADLTPDKKAVDAADMKSVPAAPAASVAAPAAGATATGPVDPEERFKAAVDSLVNSLDAVHASTPLSESERVMGIRIADRILAAPTDLKVRRIKTDALGAKCPAGGVALFGALERCGFVRDTVTAGGPFHTLPADTPTGAVIVLKRWLENERRVRWVPPSRQEAEAKSGIVHDKDGQPDFPATLAALQKGAEAGEGPAMARYGALLANGMGVAKDEATAVRWMRRSADELKCAEGQVMMAQALLEGHYGLHKDQKAAVAYLQAAAEQGNAHAMIALGHCYTRGTGVPVDHAKAVEYTRRACVKGTGQSPGLAGCPLLLRPLNAPRLVRPLLPAAADVQAIPWPCAIWAVTTAWAAAFQKT